MSSIRIAITICFIAGTASLPASADPAQASIPNGHDWFCYRTHATYNPLDRASRCVRSAERCEQLRESSQSDTSVSDECREQTKAAIVTYFDVMQDEWRAWPTPSTEECNEIRRYLVRSPDNRSVSACRTVGDVVPPPSRFALENLPVGDDWFCPTDRTKRCVRSVDQCTTDDADAPNSSSCTKQAKVFAVTTGSAATNNGLYAAFSTSTACNASRVQIVLKDIALSPCTLVGAIPRPALSAKKLPEGSGWFCYSVKDGSASGGQCARTLEECTQTRTGELGGGKEPSECTQANTAYARDTGGVDGVVAYPSLALCESEMRQHLSGSKCERVR